MTVSLEEQTDEQLLTQYLNARDQRAFAEIVRRHGPLVWGVCRRVLGNTHDAEDAFQASFVVLVNKARSIRKMKSIAGWLHKVSHHVALRARKRASVRVQPANLSEMGLLMASAAPSSLPDEDLLRMLSEEIARLPDGLRESVVLCYMQGLTNGQAAKQLGCLEGTVVSRLARARDRLQRRLRSRGFIVSGAMALTTLLEGSVTAAPPALLVENVLIHARSAAGAAVVAGSGVSVGAALLADETLKQLLKQQVVQWCAISLLGFAVVAGAWVLYRMPARVHESTGAAVDQAALSVLDGTWQAVKLEFAPGSTPVEQQEFIDCCRWVINRGELRMQWLWETRIVARIVPLQGSRPQIAELTILKGPPDVAGKTLRAVFESQADHLSLRIDHAPPDLSGDPVVIEPLASESVAAYVGVAGLSEFRRQTPLESATFGVRASAMQMLQGNWSLKSWSRDGRTFEVQAADERIASIRIDRIAMHPGDIAAKISGKFALDPSEPDRYLEIISTIDDRPRHRKCLYELNGDTLRLCVAEAGRDRPHDMGNRAGDQSTLLVFEHLGGAADRSGR